MSIVDDLMFRRGALHPGLYGVNRASVPGIDWFREPPETEHQFVSRVRAAAAALGFAIVAIHGAVETCASVTPLRRDPDDAA
jgi:hypothetical protein